ncbi:MAG: phosphate ABC transporter ATP-binding protein [Candidatus Binatia bacterium]
MKLQVPLTTLRGLNGTRGEKTGPRAFTLGPLEAGPPCCVAEALIRVDALSLHYGRTPAFEDITLTINRGCVTALIGPSGCGKTSFLNCLNRLTDMIPGCHVSGGIMIGDTDVRSSAVDLRALRQRVGMIFQKPNPFPLSIRKNIDLPLRESDVATRKPVEEIREVALRQVGLWEEVKDRLDAPAMSLSGGQQQRLCIARAIALRPDVLLMDEPCSSLDPISSGVVEDLIDRLREDFTILVVTHNLGQARRIADYAAMFWIKNGSGRLIEQGTASQVFESPSDAITAAYMAGGVG